MAKELESKALSSPRRAGAGSGILPEALPELFLQPAIVLAADRRIRSANGPFCRMFRVSVEEALGSLLAEVGESAWEDSDIAALDRGLSEAGAGASEFEVKPRLNASEPRTLRLAARLLPNGGDLADGNGAAMLVELQDLTESRQIADHLHLQRTAMDSAANAIFITNRDGVIEWANPAVERLSGFSIDEVIGQTPRIFKSGEQSHQFYMHFWERVLSGKPWNGRVSNRHKEGHLYTVEQTVTPIVDPANGVTHFVAIHEDITVRLESERRIAHMARHDFLTDLPNRFALDERLDLELARAARLGRQVVVMVLDLDHFKDVNDTFGHATGDRLLIQVAERLRAGHRQVDMVARLGGDEFALVLVDIEDVQSVVEIAQGLLARFEEPFEIESRLLYVNASIGIGVFSKGALPKEDLMKQADLALYRAKRGGRNTYRFYRPEMDRETQRRMSLGQDLHTAIAKNQLFVEYQPQVELDGQRVIGVEALLRWRHPEHGVVSPNEFVPIAESSGLMVPIGEWVLRTACLQAIEWRRNGIEAMPMAVNVSAIQLRDPAFPALVSETLTETGLEPAFLELELTERVLMEANQATEGALKALNALGVRLSLDDFGRGYASLDYLRRYPLQKLKIGRSFVSDMSTNDKNATIVEAVIRLATRLDLQVIAEGVEPEELLEQLVDQGCREAQGFYFSRPIPPDELEDLLRRGSGRIVS